MDDQTPYEELGPAQPSNSTNVVPFEKPKKRISAKTERLIGQLGLRYRPSAQADIEEHAAALALLTADVADIPPHILDEAISRHVAQSPYMPKASELIALAKEVVAPPSNGKPVDMAARRNAQLRAEGNFSLHWYYDQAGQIKLETVTEQAARHKHAEQFA